MKVVECACQYGRIHRRRESGRAVMHALSECSPGWRTFRWRLERWFEGASDAERRR
jgi:hypothetical protein